MEILIPMLNAEAVIAIAVMSLFPATGLLVLVYDKRARGTDKEAKLLRKMSYWTIATGLVFLYWVIEAIYSRAQT